MGYHEIYDDLCNKEDYTGLFLNLIPEHDGKKIAE